MSTVKCVGNITHNTEARIVPKLVPIKIKRGTSWVISTGYIQSNGRCVLCDGTVLRFGQWRYVGSIN